MALSRSTPLLTTAGEVTDLTGIQDLANLAVGGEFAVADSLLRAHELVFDEIERIHGEDAPAKITNETRLERAVAARFLERLFATTLDDPERREYWASEARAEIRERYRIQMSSGDEARAGEALPAVRNLSANSLFGSLR